MSEQPLSFGRVLAIQLRLALAQGWRGRLIGFLLVFVQLAAMALGGVLLGVTVNTDGVAFAQVVDLSKVLEVPLTRGTFGLGMAAIALGVIAWFGPFKLWDGEPPRQRGYHWAMPVAKGTHDLARVAAGLVLLLGWEAVFYGSVVVLSLLAEPDTFAAMTPALWACLALGPMLLYLLTSFFTVRMEHPSGWLWSILGGLAAVSTVSTVLGLESVMRLLEGALFGRWGLASAVGAPVGEFLADDRWRAASWPLAWSLWFAILVGALLWGAHDRRRIP